MTRRLWWRVEEILPLAEHAAATPQHRKTRQQYRAGWPDVPALIWSREPDGAWLSSNGVPIWYDRDGTEHRARAETWTHTATGATGNPTPSDGEHGFLPLRATYLDGHRTLLDLLRFARDHTVHWFGLCPDPASDETNDHYLLSVSRGDVIAPMSTWKTANVTSETVGGGTYRAMVANGHTTLDGGVLCRFPRGAVRRMADNLKRLQAGDMPGEHPMLRFDDDVVVVEWEQDRRAGTWIIREMDRVSPDANGCYAIGAYQWRWTNATLAEEQP
ncbi:hypothetical protein GCM10027290_29980 [Micromonospora sonneratiae]|uniref:Uncharacterized protein n=1 Tax=Micromonospora sonneratiae TaxID=1184706 RepID=A0ABW3YHL8_9ACTN